MYTATMKYVFIKRQILQRWEICLSGGRENWIHPTSTMRVRPACLKWRPRKAPHFFRVMTCFEHDEFVLFFLIHVLGYFLPKTTN